MGASRIVIVIVSYGRPADVARCLTSIAGSTVADYEVAVVENAGSDAFSGLSDHLRQCGLSGPLAADAESAVADGAADVASAGWSRLRLIGPDRPLTLFAATDNLGYGGGINVALRAIAGRPGWDAVWVLNPDTMPEPGAMAALRRHAADGSYGLIGSRLVFSDTGRVQMRGAVWRRLIARGLGLGIGELADAPVDVAALEARLDWVSGAAMYATRAFVETVGAMDDSYFLYCEDVDWSLRRGAFKLGYAHQAIVYHEHGTSIGSSVDHQRRSPLSIYLMERNRLMLTRRHFPGSYPVVALVCLAGLLQSYALRGNWSGLAVGLRGWLAGVRGEVGRPAL